MTINAFVEIFDPGQTGELTTSVDPVTNVPAVQLPPIAASPTAPQAGVGAIVAVRSDVLYGGRVLDPAGNVIARYTGLSFGLFLADVHLVWVQVPLGNILATLLKTPAVASGGQTIGVGSGTVPAGLLTNPGKIAGLAPGLLDDGSIGWFLYWQ